MTGLILAAAIAAPPQAPKPPQAPPVEQKPMCICGDACKCPTGDCPGKCPVKKGTAPVLAQISGGWRLTFADAGGKAREYTHPTRPDDEFVAAIRAMADAESLRATTSPAKAAPVQRYELRWVCTGSKCEQVQVPVP